MPLRPFRMPADSQTLLEIIPPAFQYPENDAWSIQEDEVVNLVDSVKSVQRIWPLFRLIQVVYSPLRDAIHGFIWEEEGVPVGLVNLARRRESDDWVIGNVAVLPQHRRRGIARQLVRAAIELARERGARRITLDVLADNVPAYALYTKLGFEHYASSVKFEYDPGAQSPHIALPGGYTVMASNLFDWRKRYKLAGRIIPEDIQEYEPVEESLYRVPGVMRPLVWLLTKLSRVRQGAFATSMASSGLIVAVAAYEARTGAGGVSQVSVMLDPAHPSLALFLLTFLVGETQRLSPGRRIECTIPRWQTALAEAAALVGFVKRFELHRLGMIL